MKTTTTNRNMIFFLLDKHLKSPVVVSDSENPAEKFLQDMQVLTQILRPILKLDYVVPPSQTVGLSQRIDSWVNILKSTKCKWHGPPDMKPQEFSYYALGYLYLRYNRLYKQTDILTFILNFGNSVNTRIALNKNKRLITVPTMSHSLTPHIVGL